jgi:hypothetical protein
MEHNFFLFFTPEKSSDTHYDAPGSFAPAAAAASGYDNTVLPVHITGGFFCTGNPEALQCAPAPQGGRAGARGEIIT